MPISPEYLQERIDKTKELIAALEDASVSLMTGAILQYTLDTGQSRTVVTKASISEINRVLDSLYNRLATLCARLDGSGVQIARPEF